MKKHEALFMTLIMIFLSAQNVHCLEQKDVSITLSIPAKINQTQEYDEFFLLKNNNDTPSVNDALELELSLEIESANNSISTKSVNKTLNSYSRTGLGKISIGIPGNYSICINATPKNYYDPNNLNNDDCREVIVVESNMTNGNETNTTLNVSSENNTTPNVTSSCTIVIITSKEIFQDEKIIFKLDWDKEKSIMYWIETLDGEIAKARLNTSSSTEKTYTPSHAESEKAYLIKAIVEGCNNTGQKLVVSKKTINESEETDTALETTLSISAVKQDSSIIYITIDGYKADTAKTLISIWLEKDGKKKTEITKTYIEQKYSTFKQMMPILAPNLESGSYEAKAEGLGLEASKEIEIEATIKQESEKTTTTTTKSTTQNNTTKNITTTVKTTTKTNITNKTEEPKKKEETAIQNESTPTEKTWIESNKEKIIFLSILTILTILMVGKDLRRSLINKTKRFNNGQRKLLPWTENK